MNWIDSGVNLLDTRFTLDDVLKRALDADVKQILVISSDIEESSKAIALCEQVNNASIPELKASEAKQTTDNNQNQEQHLSAFSQPRLLACTAGVHPHYADNTTPASWTKLKAQIADKNAVAVGECGLDFNRNFSSRKNQLYAFEAQLALAAQHNLGVYLHERDAFDEQITLLQKYAGSLQFMVAHCFTGNAAQLSSYLDLGCYIGITGWLCDEKRGIELREAAKALPLDRLLLETDAPYLFPKTLRPRKSTNEPCNIPFIAEQLATLKSCSLVDIKSHAYQNASKLFFRDNQ